MRYVIEEGKNARSSWYVAEDGHIYLKKSTKKSKIYVRCKHERDQKSLKCSATGVIEGEELIVNKAHNHGPVEESLEQAHAYVSLRNKAREAAGALRPSAIFDEVAREEGALVAYSAAKQVIQRERKFYRSPPPATAATAVAAITASEPKVQLQRNIAFTIVTEDEQEYGQGGSSSSSARATHGKGPLAEGVCPDHGDQTCSSPGSVEEEQNSEEAEVPVVLEETGYDQLDSILSDSEDSFDNGVQERMGGGGGGEGEGEGEAEAELGGLGEAGHSGLRAPGFAATPPSRTKRAPPAKKSVAKRAKTANQSHNELVMKTLDELSRREEDPDRNFLLSLLPYLNKMPENVRARAKTHILTHFTECAYPNE